MPPKQASYLQSDQIMKPGSPSGSHSLMNILHFLHPLTYDVVVDVEIGQIATNDMSLGRATPCLLMNRQWQRS